MLTILKKKISVSLHKRKLLPDMYFFFRNTIFFPVLQLLELMQLYFLTGFPC